MMSFSIHSSSSPSPPPSPLHIRTPAFLRPSPAFLLPLLPREHTALPATAHTHLLLPIHPQTQFSCHSRRSHSTRSRSDTPIACQITGNLAIPPSLPPLPALPQLPSPTRAALAAPPPTIPRQTTRPHIRQPPSLSWLSHHTPASLSSHALAPDPRASPALLSSRIQLAHISPAPPIQPLGTPSALSSPALPQSRAASRPPATSLHHPIDRPSHSPHGPPPCPPPSSRPVVQHPSPAPPPPQKRQPVNILQAPVCAFTLPLSLKRPIGRPDLQFTTSDRAGALNPD
ncbi:hypothetical protein BV20DRAFT_298717 [Pilatotrama ljubarskyi]|nr:hypothetical protein BV20DRAFT_298717 [Pilatotrama ljubarskyi]